MNDSLPPRSSFRSVNSILSKAGFTAGRHHTGWNSYAQTKDGVSGFWTHRDTGRIVYVCTDCLAFGGNTAYLRLADSEKDYTGHRNHHVSTKSGLAETALSIVNHAAEEEKWRV